VRPVEGTGTMTAAREEAVEYLIVAPEPGWRLVVATTELCGGS
jgi:hypothetical protein